MVANSIGAIHILGAHLTYARKYCGTNIVIVVDCTGPHLTFHRNQIQLRFHSAIHSLARTEYMARIMSCTFCLRWHH